MSTAVAQMMSAPPSPPGSNTPWGARYAAELRQVIVRQASRQPRNQQEFLGPSELGTVCDRQVVGKMIAAPVTNHVPDPWPSIVGTAVHAWLADKFARENDLIGMLRWLTETRVAPDPMHPGTADLFDLFEGALVDWKALGPTSMDKVKSPGRPAPQVSGAAAPVRPGLPQLRRGGKADSPGRAAPHGGHPGRHVRVGARSRHSQVDDALVDEVLRVTEVRRQIAARILEGRMTLAQVPATPDSGECFYCPLYRPQAAYDGGPGCPGITSPASINLSLAVP